MKTNPQSTLFEFESLELYKKSLEYIDFIYELVRDFPDDERYELTSQFKRATLSITLNIAEGYGESIPLAIRYLRIVRGSIRECLACSTIAYRSDFLNESLYHTSQKQLTELSKLASGYRNYLNKKMNK